jgi:uncharacterized protein YycO
MFTRDPGSLITAGIGFFSHGYWSHVQVVTEWPMVISADAEGVVARTADGMALDSWIVLRCPIVGTEKAEEIVRLAWECVGKGYDFLGLLGFLVNSDSVESESRYFCSELVFEIFRRAGIALLKRVDPALVSPRDLFISPLLETVG